VRVPFRFNGACAPTFSPSPWGSGFSRLGEVCRLSRWSWRCFSALPPGCSGRAARRQLAPLAWRSISVLACAVLGLAWAALLAEQRLQERLPAEWEGRDLQIVGVVAGLPQDFENGERFAFCRRVGGVGGVGCLAAGAGAAANHALLVPRPARRRALRSADRSARRSAQHSPGRALAVHRAPETAARQRQSARFRLRGLALRARPAGDRLCAPERRGAAPR
jgi:hypothetical protein